MTRLAVTLALLAGVSSEGRTVSAEACVTLEDFGQGAVGELPPGWRLRTGDGAGVYRVASEEGRRFLRATAHGVGVQAARSTEGWDLDAHPVLAWSWRPREFPHGADERRRATNDSPLAVYLLVEYSKVRGPQAVKYVWSERVPVGTRLESNGGLTQVRVLRSGPPPAAAAWVEERVNVREDYRAYFRQGATPRPAGLAVLTDADDTRSTASGDYANFRACRG